MSIVTTIKNNELYRSAKSRLKKCTAGIISDFDCIVEQEKEIMHYREKIEMLTEQLKITRNKVPENETEVLKLVNETLEMLWVIDKHTKMNRTYLREAMYSLSKFRIHNYINHVDWKCIKVGD